MTAIMTCRAESTSLCHLMMAAVTILFEYDIHCFVKLKDEYLPHGLRDATRLPEHPFWTTHGPAMWRDVHNLMKARIAQDQIFGQDPISPETVGVFQTET